MPLIANSILFLDLATSTGWAYGVAGQKPISGSFKVGRGGYGPGQLGVWLRDFRREHGIPDLIGIEKWLPLRAAVNDRAVEVALRLNGAAHCMAAIYGVPVAEPTVQAIRAAVCGRASAGSREETKAMVVATMKLLKLMPADAKDDDDRADALAGWSWCEAVYGRCAPAEFILTP